RESTELSVQRRRKADLEAKSAEAKAAVSAHEARRGTILSEWRSLWPTGFITVQLPGEMTEWLTQRADGIAEADDVAAERDAIAELVDKERDARQALIVAMTAFAAGPHDGGLESLQDRARSIIGDIAEAKTLYDKADAAVRGQSERKIEADEAADKLKARIDDWTATWRAALAEARLPPHQTIEAASATLGVAN